MKTLAIDIGSSIGMASNIPGWGPLHKTFDGDRRERAGNFMCHMNRTLRLLKSQGLECVIYEDTFARGVNAAKSLYGMIGVIEATCWSAGFPAMWVSPATVKKWATGKGNATKEDMLSAAQLLGYVAEGSENEHEADAYCLLCYAEASMIEEAREEINGG
jgi:Holliday junction resolvasome RuvABC endonuclease subunit